MVKLITFIFGTIIGSGINALDRRHDTNKSWLADRSECPQCGHKLFWWELIPLVSFFYLGGRCSSCGESISWQYPLVELASGLLFVLLFLTLGISIASVFAAVVWTLLLVIYVHDARTLTVPYWAVWAFNWLALVSVFVSFPAESLQFAQIDFISPGWLSIAAGPLLALPFGLIWLFSGGRAMGFADAKIALGIGWLVGAADGLSAVVFAFWIGAAVSLALLGFQRLWKSHSSDHEKKLTMKTAVPFGPFLILGLQLVYFAGITLL